MLCKRKETWDDNWWVFGVRKLFDSCQTWRRVDENQMERRHVRVPGWTEVCFIKQLLRDECTSHHRIGTCSLVRNTWSCVPAHRCPASVQAAVTRGHRLGGPRTTETYFWQLAAEQSDTKAPTGSGVGRGGSLVLRRWILLRLHVINWAGDLPGASGTRTLTLVMRMPPSWPNQGPEALPPNTIPLGIQSQHTNSVCSMYIFSSIHPSGLSVYVNHVRGSRDCICSPCQAGCLWLQVRKYWAKSGLTPVDFYFILLPGFTLKTFGAGLPQEWLM